VRSDYNYGYKSSGGLSKKPSFWGFVFPFIFFIIIGVVCVIGFDIYMKFYGTKPGDFISVTSVSGDVQVKSWGDEIFSSVFPGSSILQGDKIMTGKDSFLYAEFPDSVSVSLSPNTVVVFDHISENYSSDIILESGSVSFTGFFNGNVYAGSTLIKPNAYEFEISSDGIGSVIRVLDGKVDVDIYGLGGNDVVDHISIVSGEQAIFTEDKLKRFWEYQAPNVVEKIDF